MAPQIPQTYRALLEPLAFGFLVSKFQRFTKKFISCFLADVDPISKMLKILFDFWGSFLGFHDFPKAFWGYPVVRCWHFLGIPWSDVLDFLDEFRRHYTSNVKVFTATFGDVRTQIVPTTPSTPTTNGDSKTHTHSQSKQLRFCFANPRKYSFRCFYTGLMELPKG